MADQPTPTPIQRNREDASARIIRNGERGATKATYPKSGTHTWNSFPLVAIETGGYNDATLIDPWNGDELYVPGAAQGESLASILRRVADALEATGFESRDD